MLRLLRQDQRQALAGRLSDYEFQLDGLWKSLAESKIVAVKCFAREVGIITYKECFEMTTHELIEKIKAEAE